MSHADVRLIKTIGSRYCTDNNDPAKRVEVQHCGVMDGAGGIVEEDIHAVRAGPRHISGEIGRGAMIDGVAIANLLAPLTFCIGPDNGDRVQPLDPRNLPGNLPYGS